MATRKALRIKNPFLVQKLSLEMNLDFTDLVVISNLSDFFLGGESSDLENLIKYIDSPA